MASVNKTIILGVAGRDAEVRFLPSGQAVANVSIATNSFRKDKTSGEKTQETQWHRIVMYDRLAEIAGEYLKKGKQVYIEGRLKYGKYTDKDGVEKNTCDIVATEMQLLGGRGEGENEAAAKQRERSKPNAYQEAKGRGAAPAPTPARQSSGFDDMDDDIPWN